MNRKGPMTLGANRKTSPKKANVFANPFAEAQDISSAAGLFDFPAEQT